MARQRQSYTAAFKARADLFEQMGRLKRELEGLKKKLPSSVDGRRPLIEANHPDLSVCRPGELRGMKKSPRTKENYFSIIRGEKRSSPHVDRIAPAARIGTTSCNLRSP